MLKEVNFQLTIRLSTYSLRLWFPSKKKHCETEFILEGFSHYVFHSLKETKAQDWFKKQKSNMIWLDLGLGLLNLKSVSSHHNLMLDITYHYKDMGRRKLFYILNLWSYERANGNEIEVVYVVANIE